MKGSLQPAPDCRKLRRLEQGKRRQAVRRKAPSAATLRGLPIERWLMAIFNFWTRRPQRDHETDRTRFHAVVEALRKARSETEDERHGLEARYEDAQSTAAFAEQRAEDFGEAALDREIDDLTGTIVRCQERLGQLDRHLRFLREVERSVCAYSGLPNGGREAGDASASL